MPARKRSSARRENHHLEGAVVVSRRVEFIGYRHAQSRTRAAYEHQFGPGVELLALRDGTLLLRSKSGRKLYDDFLVGDEE